LICMAVISLVLGGAYVTSRRSQIAVRDSQEHGEALKLLESQIEQLRSDAANATTSSDIFQSGQFCMSQQGARVATGPIPAADCVQESDGSQAPLGFQPAYTLAIQCTVGCSASLGWLFRAEVTWPSVTGGSGQGDETMYYRLYP
jgi:hypothetical protein